MDKAWVWIQAACIRVSEARGRVPGTGQEDGEAQTLVGSAEESGSHSPQGKDLSGWACLWHLCRESRPVAPKHVCDGCNGIRRTQTQQGTAQHSPHFAHHPMECCYSVEHPQPCLLLG